MIRFKLIAAVAGLLAGASAAQAQGVPPGHMPPPGSCRVWHPGVPPGQQPPPTDCRSAERQADSNGGRVVYGGRGGDWDDDRDWNDDRDWDDDRDWRRERGRDSDYDRRRREWDHDDGPWQHDDRDERWGDRGRGDVFDRGFDVRADRALTGWALRHFDWNRDGRLGGREARAANQALWRIADRDRDGRISPREYRRARARLARS